MKHPIFSFKEITPEILNLIAEIDGFRGKWESLGKIAPDRLLALKKVATVESVGSSTRIEGARLSNDEVEKLLSNLRITPFKSRDEEEVAGYVEAMSLIFDSHEDISLSENHIKQLHSILLKHSSKDVRHRGEYKTLPNHVEAFDHEGKSLGVIFETATPFDTPERMRALVEWTNKALVDKEYHFLLIVGFFIVHFLAIHPFQDGNGRLSRILTNLLLLQHGYQYTSYSSLERVVEENKDQYYLALRQAQGTIFTDNAKLNNWVLFFLKALKSQKDNLLRKIEIEKIIVALPKLSEDIMRLCKEHGRITITEIEKATKTSRNTIKGHLKNLVSIGYLKQNGKGKGVFYTSQM